MNIVDQVLNHFPEPKEAKPRASHEKKNDPGASNGQSCLPTWSQAHTGRCWRAPILPGLGGRRLFYSRWGSRCCGCRAKLAAPRLNCKKPLQRAASRETIPLCPEKATGTASPRETREKRRLRVSRRGPSLAPEGHRITMRRPASDTRPHTHRGVAKEPLLSRRNEDCSKNNATQALIPSLCASHAPFRNN